MLRTGRGPNLIAVVLALGTPATSPHAQALARTVSGVVRDTLGRPLEDAVIVLNPTGAQRATRADAGGRFRFDRVEPGRYAMRTTWIGYEPDERVYSKCRLKACRWSSRSTQSRSGSTRSP